MRRIDQVPNETARGGTPRRTTMRTSLLTILLASLGGAGLLTGCTTRTESTPSGGGAADSGRPVVAVTVEVNRYLAERIGGDAIEVVYPVPAEADPLHWDPDRDAIATLQSADLVLLNGAGLELWRDRISLAPSKTVVLADAYRERWLTFEGAVEHQHGPEGDHTHTGTDPHVWMDPTIVSEHARQIVTAFAERFPAHADAFAARGIEVLVDLEDLDRRWGEVFPGEGSPPLLTNHPAYDYLARRHSWTVQNFDVEPEGWTETERTAVARAVAPGVRWMLWESEPDAEISRYLGSIGLVPVVISPCEHTPDEGDWLSVMRENVTRLAERAASPPGGGAPRD